MKRAIVCGAGGFIGHHLVNRLKSEGYKVLGIDIKYPEFENTQASDFVITDLRDYSKSVKDLGGYMRSYKNAEIYQLAADMGGMGFIHSHEVDCLTNNSQINQTCLRLAMDLQATSYFYSSSVCVYRDVKDGELLTENDAYPAMPDNEYGWEKLYSERVALAYAREQGLRVRIARFQNTYGPLGTWYGGREKAPAAISRKVAESQDGNIEVWGDGSAIRNYIYVSDLVDGIRKLVWSDIEVPTNIGGDEYVSVDQLVDTVAKIAGKDIEKKYVEGPVGVLRRNFSNELIKSTGWKSRVSLEEGIKLTYPWIEEQVKQK